MAPANGVLPIPVSAIQKGGNTASSNPSAAATPADSSTPAAKSISNGGGGGAKATSPRLKLVLRRLPPGLVQAELESALGDEWKLGEGKVDYFLFKPGKVSTDLAKPSRPARAYFRVTSASHIPTLSSKIQSTPIVATAHPTPSGANVNSLHTGQPTLEFAPYARVPSAKRRVDARQGSIDTDPDFKAFLERLTNPSPKTAAAAAVGDAAVTAAGAEDDSTDAESKAAVITTPLIEHLREKKAAKERERAEAKAAAAAGKKDGRHVRKESREQSGKTSGTTVAGDKKGIKAAREKGDKGTAASPDKKPGSRRERTDKATKEAVRVLQARDRTGSSEATTTISSSKAVAPPPLTEAGTAAGGAVASGGTGGGKEAPKERRRGSAAVAAKMLQRDLGLAPRRSRKAEAAAAASGSAADNNKQGGAGVAADAVEGGGTKVSEQGVAVAAAGQGERGDATKQDGGSRGGEVGQGKARGRKGGEKSYEKAGDATGGGQQRSGPTRSERRAAKAASIAAEKEARKEQLAGIAEGAETTASKAPPKPPVILKKSPAGESPLSADGVHLPATTDSASSFTSGPKTAAFLKHANPSQGVTVESLTAALSAFGVLRPGGVELDARRKGFATAVFERPEGLAAAVAGSPVRVEQASVVVVEKREKTPGGGSASKGT
ncbi:Smg-4/UPF3 family-domain-containing protein, partial [Lineolata rhizophorae]